MSDENTIKRLVKSIEKDAFSEYLQEFHKNYRPEPIDDYESEDWKQERIRAIKISQFVRLSDEDDVDNLCQLYQSFNAEECAVSLLFRYEMQKIEAYFIIADLNEEVNSSGNINSLSDRAQRVFSSVYPGAKIEEYGGEVIRNTKYIVSVSNIASEKNDSFISLENLLNYQDKKDFSVLFLARNVSNSEMIRNQIDDLCNYSSELSQYESIQRTNSTTYTENTSEQFSIIVASAGKGKATAEGNSYMETYSNYSVKHMQEQINRLLVRLEMCNAIGGWRFATYIFSDFGETAKNVAYQYDALVRGKESNYIPSTVISWEG